MPSNIDIEVSAPAQTYNVEIGYSGPSVDIEIAEPTAPVIQISIGNIGPQGEPGQDGVGLSDLVLGEVPTGDINGTNDTFTTAFDFEQVTVYLNGLKETFFTTSGSNVIIIDDPPLTGDIVTVDYVKT